jgi:hypothetical protein
LGQDGQLLLEQLNILLNVLFQDAFHGVLHLRVCDAMGDADRPEMPTSN